MSDVSYVQTIDDYWGRDVHDAKLLEATLDAIVVERRPPRRNPNTCVWTKGMTILQAVGLPPDTAIGSTSASARRSWTPLATSGIRRAGGLWNGRWHGSPSAVRSWSGTTRRQRTLGVLQLACALLWFPRQWRLAILR